MRANQPANCSSSVTSGGRTASPGSEDMLGTSGLLHPPTAGLLAARRPPTHLIRESGVIPPDLSRADVLRDPEPVVVALLERLGPVSHLALLFVTDEEDLLALVVLLAVDLEGVELLLGPVPAELPLQFQAGPDVELGLHLRFRLQGLRRGGEVVSGEPGAERIAAALGSVSLPAPANEDVGQGAEGHQEGHPGEQSRDEEEHRVRAGRSRRPRRANRGRRRVLVAVIGGLDRGRRGTVALEGVDRVDLADPVALAAGRAGWARPGSPPPRGAGRAPRRRPGGV